MRVRQLIGLCVLALSACHTLVAPDVVDFAVPDAAVRIRLERVRRVGAVEHAAELDSAYSRG